MTLRISTPLNGDLVLSDRTLTSMLNAIDQTFKYSNEEGLSFCKIDEIIDPGEICEGDSCSVDIQGCPEGTEKVGDFHTHPNTWQRRGYAHPSITDSAEGLIAGSKLTCIWGQQDNYVACRSPVRKLDPKEKTIIESVYDQITSILPKILAEQELSPKEMAKIHEFNELVTELSREVLLTDRAGLAEARLKVRSFEDCLTYYSHKELAERAKKAGIGSEGGKKELCRKLMEAKLL